MIIDCHNYPDWHGHDLEKFLANMAKFNIDVIWLLSWECPSDEYAWGNYSVTLGVDSAGKHPWRT